MSFKQDSQQAFVLAEKPSTSFSSFSSAASATSVGTSRSGGSRLLFGEIDSSSERSDTFASVCSLVLSDSSTFLRFWLNDNCRENLISHLPKPDLASLRLVCHDFSVRAAPALFEHLSITFKTSTFTKPARLVALDRLGFHVKTLTFTLPHTQETALPPLIEPDTGEELSFTYTPQAHAPRRERPKFGDEGTASILARQYPPLFHAATNVPAFARGFSAFINLAHLKVACPGYDVLQRSCRSTVDFALISLRIAVERNALNSLHSLTLSPIHPSGILHLSPLLGYGATPASGRRWSCIKHLTIDAHSPSFSSRSSGRSDHVKLLHTYLSNFQSNLRSFTFAWLGDSGPLPFAAVRVRPKTLDHPAHAVGHARPHFQRARSDNSQALHFPNLNTITLTNATTTASEVSSFLAIHKSTIEDLDLNSIELTSGSWDDALAPLDSPSIPSRPDPVQEVNRDDIPIMFSPEQELQSPIQVNVEKALPPPPPPRSPVTREMVGNPRPRKMERSSRGPMETHDDPSTVKKVKRGFAECEQRVRRVFRGGLGLWR
ncbi:hypothetical protein B0A48_03513 [Cryoendolithus antarcticus]|uniref:F-box domain-containing protein n=1 Tax=Cryoendolithus antarcticus TaxID=1507870 RepID=A0A1V8TK83_9PEZI|nr:hypothetical protein B0A48_03513 [Cryoendolithus antarcticus]